MFVKLDDRLINIEQITYVEQKNHGVVVYFAVSGEGPVENNRIELTPHEGQLLWDYLVKDAQEL